MIIKTVNWFARKSREAVEVFNTNYNYTLSRVLKRNKIEPYYFKTYELMLSDNQQKSNPFWERLAKNFKKELIAYGLDDFKKSYENRHFSGRFPATTLEESALWQYYKHVKSKDRFDIMNEFPESSVGNPMLFEYDGDKVSWDYIKSVDEFYNIFDTFKLKREDKLTICDIGAGYGRLAEIFLKVMPNVNYVIVDLPSSLIIAYYYLSKVFKGDVNKYEDTRNLSHFDKKILLNKRLTFLLLHQFKNIDPKSVNLFINISSFQEMNPDMVKKYLKQIKDLKGDFLYLKNDGEGIQNLIDTKSFKLIECPRKMGMNIIKENRSQPDYDVIEQFIKF